MRDVHVAALRKDRKVSSLCPGQGNLVNKAIILLLVAILNEFTFLLSIEDIFQPIKPLTFFVPPLKTN